ncbi:hypothetical protein Rvan_2054 [Rhodomicrobium vannielii ATCC 17100]|uniref:Rad50/SbcC-type AAA domain-containing protein n=1 Tax=Rhodomicrobium vannielii (strain ATCC 17100 / DSM 162 / LMG 4299 / NCIMB 10020 / ATH 3.1.1) TaxID=648757 RepID=E3I1Y1_RHOVT|nr:hypothetical protein [Rhodomicrobium vannielii]ADP71282.1 hypothetical protein Rvan_2054 [Rhodomicrobium vannielii ATCC 17100]
MLQLRKILIRGSGVSDASVGFTSGGNIVAGESETGKSYLLRCVDYIFGADELSNRIPEDAPYLQLYVEFQNSSGEILTLERSLKTGDMAAYPCRISDISLNTGARVIPRRHGKSAAKDVTSVLFPFAGIPDAMLRSNSDGKTQRLTIRTFIPLIMVDEVSVIEKQSPVLGPGGYDSTARKRMFAFILSGKDDEGIVANEKQEITKAKASAKLGVIAELIAPLEDKVSSIYEIIPNEIIDRVDISINDIYNRIFSYEKSSQRLEEKRKEAIADTHYAEAQMRAIDELLTRYRLLEERYSSDLSRLDFIAEGAHYFEALQEVKCPLCDQLMTPHHAHLAASSSAEIYESARAEASKILAQQKDLYQAIESLNVRREERERQWNAAKETLERTERRLDQVLQPALRADTIQLQALIARRVDLETKKADRDQLDSLRAMKAEIERVAYMAGGTARQWEPLPRKALRAFCDEIEAVLKEWRWVGPGQVEFDDTAFDIIVDGQARQSHGKGVRAVLHSAFVVALLRYCQREGRPHPGFIMIDSPLTSYKKKGSQVKGRMDPVDSCVEEAFWNSLKSINRDIQVIVIENKEPPLDVAKAVNYEWFAGGTAKDDDRAAFIPLWRRPA